MEQSISTRFREEHPFRSIPTISSTTNNSTTKEIPDSVINEEMNDLREEWRQNLAGDMPAWLQRKLRERIAEGLDYLVVVYALREAGMAPRPSWKYAEAVLLRCLREKRQGVWLLEEQRARLSAW